MTAPTLGSRPSVSAQGIHDLIVLGLWRLNARAERIRGLGLTPRLIRAELTDARGELLRLYEKLLDIHQVLLDSERPAEVMPQEVSRG